MVFREGFEILVPFLKLSNYRCVSLGRNYVEPRSLYGNLRDVTNPKVTSGSRWHQSEKLVLRAGSDARFACKKTQHDELIVCRTGCVVVTAFSQSLASFEAFSRTTKPPAPRKDTLRPPPRPKGPENRTGGCPTSVLRAGSSRELIYAFPQTTRHLVYIRGESSRNFSSEGAASNRLRERMPDRGGT